MRLPEFVTFTGADDATDVDEMVALSKRYPIEWGVLHSAKRQGLDPRYPVYPRRFADRGLRLAAHLCGDYARGVMDGRWLSWPPHLWSLVVSFPRVQVNHEAPDLEQVVIFAREAGVHAIVQARSAVGFPDLGDAPGAHRVSFLYDASGGRGAAPPAWPPHPGGDRLVGYAGGIGPENVREVLAAIDAPGPYWIDMESGVRLVDRFDLERVRAVCEAVFG